MVLTLSCATFAASSENRNSLEDFSRGKGLAFLSDINASAELSNPVPMYNLSGGLEAYCFDVDQTGYIIVNCIDGSVPEYSPESPSPLTGHENVKIYYNGVLQYYFEDSSNYVHTVTGDIAPQTSTIEAYNRTLYPSEMTARPTVSRSFVSSSAVLRGSITGNLSTFDWEDDYQCPITATAILLDYYDRYHVSSILPTSIDTEREIKELLVSGRYVPGGRLFLREVKNGKTENGISYIGLSSYIGWYAASLFVTCTSVGTGDPFLTIFW
jgi:hypothetical protein